AGPAGLHHHGGAVFLAHRRPLPRLGHSRLHLFRIGPWPVGGRTQSLVEWPGTVFRHARRAEARHRTGGAPEGTLCARGAARMDATSGRSSMKRRTTSRDRAVRIELLRARAAIERQSVAHNLRDLGQTLTPRGLLDTFLPRLRLG